MYCKVAARASKLPAVTLELGLKSHLPRIESRLSVLLPEASLEPQVLSEAMRYSCLAPGKRLRPILVLACAEAVGGQWEDAIDAACAVEMVHCFSLIHDDLPAIDNDDLRRGRPTCHVQFGEAVALLAGDALFALAFTVLADASPASSWAVGELARASSGLVRGETLDIASEGAAPNIDLLRAIHRQKTGDLFACSCALGAHFGGGTPAQTEQLRVYGEHLGLAFQIADDVLNETSTAEELGKAAGSDRERGKLTYPSLFGLDESRRLALEARDAAIADLAGLAHQELLAELATYSCERLS